MEYVSCSPSLTQSDRGFLAVVVGRQPVADSQSDEPEGYQYSVFVDARD